MRDHGVESARGRAPGIHDPARPQWGAGGQAWAILPRGERGGGHPGERAALRDGGAPLRVVERQEVAYSTAERRVSSMLPFRDLG